MAVHTQHSIHISTMGSSHKITVIIAAAFLFSFTDLIVGNVELAPGLYIFGDSTVDGGNLPPINAAYGVDLNDSSLARRFSNGLTIADYIATFLGLPIVPAWSQVGNSTATNGVNFASSGCGILPQTGLLLGWDCWTFDKQIRLFDQYIKSNLTAVFDPRELSNHLSRSIFLISFGINDFLHNYLQPPQNVTLKTLTPELFSQFLLNELSARLRILYGFGARKVLVQNIWPLGCTPLYLRNQSDPLAVCCNQTVNKVLVPYNDSLPATLMKLQSELPGAFFSQSDNFKFVTDLKENTAQYGVTNTTGRCLSEDYGGTPCRNRDGFLYYDVIHTTQAANHVFALNCFNGTVCVPNIIRLVGAV